MKSAVKVADVASIKDALLVVPVPQADPNHLPRWLRSIDELVNGAIARALRSGDFTGKRDEVLLTYPNQGPERVVFVGLGNRNDKEGGGIRRAAAVAARKALELRIETITVWAPEQTRPGCSMERIGQVLIEGIAQGAWFFDELLSKSERRDIKRVTLLSSKEHRAEVEKGRKIGEAIAAGHLLARRLQMLPGNFCPPSYLASEARKLGRTHGHRVTVLRRTQIEREGLNALLAVAQGSAQEPRLITLEYRGGGALAPICLIGKGVTFDSGGISIKPALNMEEMKYDMSGAAAVLGTFEMLGRLKPNVNVVGVIPATENLPSGTAVKPGDVIKTHLGKTVEVINTDAEGRLILCDALSYARRFKPSCMLDVATLTGAIVIALGNAATGVMGNDPSLAREVCGAGHQAGEPCWELPLWDDYRPLLESTSADFKNVGGRAAGSITAGWFLREFVEDGMPWLHLDIAGTAWNEGHAGIAKGPSGVGVRLFSQFILGRAV